MYFNFSAIQIINEHPDYRLFENNCQNFVKYLLEAICPGVEIPDTIQCISQKLNDVSTVASNPTILPGAYPVSIISSKCTSFLTATGTTWVTASGDTWVTAAESLYSNVMQVVQVIHSCT